MSIRSTTARLISVVILLGSCVAGCSTNTVSHFDPRGQVQELVWPTTDYAYRKTGTYPDPIEVQTVAPGMSVEQVRAALGSPHFREGYDAREWDYQFHFRHPAPSTDIDTCRYKVVFDSDKHRRHVRAVYWQSAVCENAYGHQPADHAETTAVPPQIDRAMTSNASESGPLVTRQFDLSMDTLFAFNHADMESVLPAGRELLSHLIGELRGEEVREVTIRGYADRIGSPDFNQRLSERRALAIRDYLVANGVAMQLIHTVGRGAEEPLIECEALPRPALIRCLAPNRRVVIAVSVSLHP